MVNMKRNYDKKKMIENLMNPDVSMILAELEDGEKELTYLTEKLKLSSDEITKRLSYATEHGFVKISQDEEKIAFSVDKEKLNEIMETDENFSSVVDGLTELDQYLN
jgi:DNA-binding transcriptional ArsR family regulator